MVCAPSRWLDHLISVLVLWIHITLEPELLSSPVASLVPLDCRVKPGSSGWSTTGAARKTSGRAWTETGAARGWSSEQASRGGKLDRCGIDRGDAKVAADCTQAGRTSNRNRA